MRKMHPLIEDCVTSVENILKDVAINKKEIELKKLMGNLTMDVIARCAFAAKIDTHNDPNNPFVKNAEKVFRGSLSVWLSFFILLAYPKLAKKLPLTLVDSGAKTFFSTAVSKI
jgi:hypothetical protein